MKIYPTKDIRNVGIVGHGGTGKTQLVSSLLYTAGVTPRFGKVAEGTTTTDWDEEEIARKISIQTGLAYAEWRLHALRGQHRKNQSSRSPRLFHLHHRNQSLSHRRRCRSHHRGRPRRRASHHGKSLGLLRRVRHPPRFRPHLDGPRTLQLRTLHGIPDAGFWPQRRSAAMPIGAEKGFRGVIDLVAMKAHMYTPDGDGKATIEEYS